MGIDRSRYCPRLHRKIVYAGTVHGSLVQGEQSLQELAGVAVSAKQVERLTRQVGSERVVERNAMVAAFQALPLADKHQTPAEVTSPEVAVIMVDGGSSCSGQLAELLVDRREEICRALRLFRSFLIAAGQAPFPRHGKKNFKKCGSPQSGFSYG